MEEMAARFASSVSNKQGPYRSLGDGKRRCKVGLGPGNEAEMNETGWWSAMRPAECRDEVVKVTSDWLILMS